MLHIQFKETGVTYTVEKTNFHLLVWNRKEANFKLSYLVAAARTASTYLYH